MIQRMLASALFAGLAAGLIAAVLHFAFVQKFILLGEQYETGALVHFDAGGAGESALATDHHATLPQPAPETAMPDGTAVAVGADAIVPPPATADTPSDLQRNGLTVLFMVLVYCGYAMVLTAGFGLAEAGGFRITPVQGMLLGLGGFVAFLMAPAMGLAPELPGIVAADLGARQVWWWNTAAATVAGLGLMAYSRQIGLVALGIALLALPHLIGAPELDSYSGLAPPELSALFAARVLGSGLVVWAAMGWLAGYFWQRNAAI